MGKEEKKSVKQTEEKPVSTGYATGYAVPTAKKEKPVKEKKESTQEVKKKKPIKKIIIIILLLLIVAVIAYGVYYFLNGNKSSKKAEERPIVFVADGKLKYFYKGETVNLANNYEIDEDDELQASVSIDAKYVAYLDDGALKVYDIDKEERHKIADEIDEETKFIFTSDNNGVVYIADEKMYLYDMEAEEKTKITASDTMEVLGSYDGYVYYGKDEEIFKYNIKKEDSELIYKNCDNYSAEDEKLICISYEYYDGETKVEKDYDEVTDEDAEAYIDSFSFIMFDMSTGKEVKKVDNRIDDILYYSEDFSDMTYSVDKGSLVSILDDDEKDNDPVTKITTRTLCTYSHYSNGDCTRSEWYDDEYFDYTTTTSKKELNDELRTEAKTYDYKDVYYNDKKIAENIYQLIAAYKDSIVYLTYPEDVVKISSLTDADGLSEYINENVKVYYKDGDKDPVEIDLEENRNNINRLAVDKNKNVYAVIDDDLYILVDGKFELIKEDVAYLEMTMDFTTYAVTENKKEEDTYYELNGKDLILMNEDVSEVNYVDGTTYVNYNCDDDFNCDFASYKDGKLEKIANQIYNVKVLGDNKYYLFKNYSSSDYTFDLYYANGDDVTKVAEDINYFQYVID